MFGAVLRNLRPSVTTRVFAVSAASAGTFATVAMASAGEKTAATTAAPKAAATRPIVLCGPSGAGKSTLIALLRKDFPDLYGFSVSHTTRGPRPGELDGKDYYFVDKAAMEAEIAAGKFLETAHVHGNIYGTSFEAVNKVSAENRICILDIDIQGVESCKRIDFDADKYIFISPPDLAILEARLRGRGTEKEENIRKRLSAATGEIERAKALTWDGWVVNNDLEEAYVQLKALTEEGRVACLAARAAAAEKA